MTFCAAWIDPPVPVVMFTVGLNSDTVLELLSANPPASVIDVAEESDLPSSLACMSKSVAALTWTPPPTTRP